MSQVNTPRSIQPPTAAFVGLSWIALLVGVVSYIVGLWNAGIQLGIKGFYVSILMWGLFAAVSLQKTIRDRFENVPVNHLYFALCWVSVISCILFLLIGLWNSEMPMGERSSFGISYLFALFGAVAVQKNVRDLAVGK